MILDWTDESLDDFSIKPYCFWPQMPTYVPTIAVISSLTRYVNAKEVKPPIPIFIYPFFPFDISRVNYSHLNSGVAKKHIIKIKEQRPKGFTEIENGLLSFSPMVNADKDQNIPLTCADISSFSHFDMVNKIWIRKRNPLHYVRAEKALLKETKKRLRLVKKQGDFDGIANVLGLPFDWDFDPNALKMVIKDTKTPPEIVIDLSVAASRRVNGYTSIVKKLVKGLKKLMLAFNGRIAVKILSDNPEAIAAFSKQWQSQNKKQKKSLKYPMSNTLRAITGYCNRGCSINSRSPFNPNSFPNIDVHIHGNQHYQLCQAMYQKMKEQIGSNRSFAPVTTLYKWLLNAGSSLVSDELMAAYIEKNQGNSQIHYIERINAAPALITRAAAALQSEGVLVEWESLLNKIREFQLTQKNSTDASNKLLSLLQKSIARSDKHTGLLLPTSKLVQFSAKSLLENLENPVEVMHDLSTSSLNKIRRVVINGYHYKTAGEILAMENKLLGIDWLLSTQEATQLYRALIAVLSITGFSLFHPQARQLCTEIETKLGQIKNIHSISPDRAWPNEYQEPVTSSHQVFIPIAEVNFVDNSTLLVGETTDILRYDSSSAVAVFSRVKPGELCADDEILLIDAEMKLLFLEAIPQEYHAKIIGPEGVVLQYRQFARTNLLGEKVQDIESAMAYSRKILSDVFPKSNQNITKPMLKYWCEGIFSNETKSSPMASNKEEYFLDFSEVIGLNREIAKISYREGFCKTRGNHIRQGREENVALSQILIDRTMGRNYHIPEEKIDEIVEHAIGCVNQIHSIKSLKRE